MISIVNTGQFLISTRETGYRHAGAALSELLDNAIQAGATAVAINVEEVPDKPGLVHRVVVADNGRGMTISELCTALQFGGSTRYDDRSGTGRFGMGLPNASLSQARRVDVVSWRDRSTCHRIHLDLDALRELGANDLRPPKRCAVPVESIRPTTSGTVITWTACDRLVLSASQTDLEGLRRYFGRTFRRFLIGGLRLTVNGHKVSPEDPLFTSGLPGLGTPEVLPPLTLIVPTTSAEPREAPVSVVFSALPVDPWANLPEGQRSALGITKGAGVSILRAQREISFGWHFMGSKRKENYDDWWRAEISFSPLLDEQFGVTHSKQGIRPTPELEALLTPIMEHHGRALNRLARQRFAAMKGRPTKASRRTSETDRYFPQAAPTRPEQAGVRRQLSYTLTTATSPSPLFLEVKQRADGGTAVQLNSYHPFYTAIYTPLRRSLGQRGRTALDLLLLSLGAAAATTSGRSQREVALRSLLEAWSDRLAAALEE